VIDWAAFHFLRPAWLAALPLAVGLPWWLARRRARGGGWDGVVAPALLAALWLRPPGRGARWGWVLLGLGWTLAVLALAGPSWERQPQPGYRAGGALVIVLDMSPSMSAADLPPARLMRARLKIEDLLRRRREGQVALLVFADGPYLVAPLTEDVATLTNLLPALGPDILPAPGDDAAPALRRAAALLRDGGARHGDVLLLTDGMADFTAALDAARALARAGHRLGVIGVGTPQGAPVTAPGGGGTVMARLDEARLAELARAGGGRYHRLSVDDSDLAAVLPPQAARALDAARRSQARVQRWLDRGAWLLPPLLLIAALGFRRGWLGVLLLCSVALPPPARAAGWQDLWLRPDQQGYRALQHKQPAAAAQRFRDPFWRGVAQYEAGDYRAAAETFATLPGPEAAYNRGNALARLGRLREAAEAYRQALRQQPDHADAKANLALVERLLRQRQKDQRQPQQGENRQRQQQGQGQSQGAPQQGAQRQQGQQENQGAQQGQQEGQGTQKHQGPQKDAARQNDAGQRKDQSARPEEKGQPRPRAGRQPQPSPAEKPQPGARAGERPQAASGRQGSQAGQRQAEQAADEAARARQDVMPQAGRHAVPGRPGQRGIGGEDVHLEEWLRQVPDDPAGLLRRKFLLEYLRRHPAPAQ